RERLREDRRWSVAVDDGNGLIEDIAAARHRLDRLLRSVVDGPPNLDQTLRDRAFRDDDASPDGVQQLLFGHEPAVPFDQYAQHFECLWPQVDMRAGTE